MTKPDLALSQIAARFTRHDVEWSRGAYVIIDRRTASPIARLCPIPNTDRFELFYWSNGKERWTTFGNLRGMELMLESAHEIVENDPMCRIPPGRGARLKLAKSSLGAADAQEPPPMLIAGVAGFGCIREAGNTVSKKY